MSGLLTSLDPDSILLAIVWDSTGSYTPPGSPSTTTLNGITIWDARTENRLLFSSSLLDEDVVLFRDRASIGSRAFAQNIEFSNTLYFNNIEPSQGGAGTLQTNELTMTSGNTKNSNIGGTSADFFYVQVGSSAAPGGKKLLIGDGELSNPSRLRALGIVPSRDKNEHYSLVSLK